MCIFTLCGCRRPRCGLLLRGYVLALCDLFHTGLHSNCIHATGQRGNHIGCGRWTRTTDYQDMSLVRCRFSTPHKTCMRQLPQMREYLLPLYEPKVRRLVKQQKRIVGGIPPRCCEQSVL